MRLGYCLRACFMRWKISSVAVAGSTFVGRATRPLARDEQGARIGDRAGTQIALDHSSTNPVFRLRRADRLRGQDEFERLLGADEARQPLRAAGAGNDAERHLGQGESRGRRRNAIVAGERDLEPSAHHRAVHGGDHRNLSASKPLNSVRYSASFGGPANSPMSAPEKKVRAFADQDDGADVFAASNLVESLAQSGAHVRRDGVDGRIVDDDQRQLTVALDAHTLSKTLRAGFSRDFETS